MTNILGPDQARQSVGPDQGPSCLQMLTADKKKVATSMQTVEDDTDIHNTIINYQIYDQDVGFSQ